MGKGNKESRRKDEVRSQAHMILFIVFMRGKNVLLLSFHIVSIQREIEPNTYDDVCKIKIRSVPVLSIGPRDTYPEILPTPWVLRREAKV